MRVAAIQPNFAWRSRDDNLVRAERLVADAAAIGTRLVLLPEMFATGYSMDAAAISESMHGPIAEMLRTAASSHNVWVGGTFACTENTVTTNRFLLCGPDGAEHHYDKLHPFTYADEHLAYAPGDRLVTVEIDGLRCTMFVCYDLRFANAFWERAIDTDVYLVPANWPESRGHHWRSLLIARAIENQAYVVGCNRVGEADGLSYAGDSMIIDPLGRTLAHAAFTETTITSDIDAAEVAAVRRRYAFLADRRNIGAADR